MLDDGPGDVNSQTSPAELAACWDAELAAAVDEDARNDSSESWVPPIKADLVRAARNTSLRRLYPFTSMNRLCFSSCPDLLSADASIAPAHVALAPEGDYVVFQGDPSPGADEEPRGVIATYDPDEAARAVEALLTDWTG